MKTIRKILIDKPTLILVAANLLLLLVTVIYQLIKYSSLDPTVVVSFRNLPEIGGGESISGSASQLYQLALAPIITTFVAIYMMAKFLQFNRRSAALMIMSMNALVLLFSFIVANSLITLNS